MRDFSYTKDDVNYYLEARQKIKRQLNIYLRDKLSSADENKTNNNNFENTNEDNLINKLSDYDFEKDRYALKCIERLEEQLVNVRDKKIFKFRYSYNLTISEVAIEVCYNEKTVERRIQSFKDKLYNIMNSKDLRERA